MKEVVRYRVIPLLINCCFFQDIPWSFVTSQSLLVALGFGKNPLIRFGWQVHQIVETSSAQVLATDWQFLPLTQIWGAIFPPLGSSKSRSCWRKYSVYSYMKEPNAGRYRAPLSDGRQRGSILQRACTALCEDLPCQLEPATLHSWFFTVLVSCSAVTLGFL